jgi:uncharacterized membrane protein
MGKKEGNVITRLLRRWFLDAFSAMALGVFATLLMGTIIGQIGAWTKLDVLIKLGTFAKNGFVVGAAIGVAVANGLKVKPLVIFSAAVCGAVGYSDGGPLGAYVAALIGSEFANLVAGKTHFDIILVPAVSILTGGTVGLFTGPYIDAFCDWIGLQIKLSMELQPVLMGMVVSCVMGLALTAPISSAAISTVVFTQGLYAGNEQAIALAAGAATVGCCCQMVGFAVSSYRENGFSGLLAQGLGTSMLQVPNIMKHPLILIPPTLTSIILGAVSALDFVGMANGPGVYGGMGTCGLVGPAGMWGYMMPNGFDWLIFVKIVLMCVVLPAVLSFAISEAMRKLGWIKSGDMKLDL